MSTDLHVLVVPDSPDQAMTIVHPPGCPQHGHVEPVRTVDGGYVCEFEEAARETGLETTFFRPDYAVPLFGDGMFPVRPGRHPVEIGLRLATLGQGDASTRGDGGAAAVEIPLTCEWCRNAPVAVVYAVDYPGRRRVKNLVCGGCDDRAPADLARAELAFTRFTIHLEVTA